MTGFKNRLYSLIRRIINLPFKHKRAGTNHGTFFSNSIFFPPFVIILLYIMMGRWRCVRVYFTYIYIILQRAYSHYFAFSDGHLNAISVGIYYTHTRLQFIPNTVCYFDLFCKNVPIIYRNYRGNAVC